MNIKKIITAPLLALSLVSAAPSLKSTTFEVMALRSGTPIHFEALQAGRNSFFLDLPDQKATCTSRSDNAVTLELINGELQLFKRGGTRQTVYVDRSDMGQGVLHYTSSTAVPYKAERKGWKIDKYGDLTFDGASLIACPHAISNSWSVWISTGASNPGGNKGCLAFVARAIRTNKPNSCIYTERN